MKNKHKKEIILQTLIVLTCSLVLAFQFINKSTNAQTICDGQPAVQSNPKTKAWEQGTTVSVIVFDHAEQSEVENLSDFQKINEGIQLWNPFSISNCSNVTFNQATRANRPYDVNEVIPNDTIFVARLSNTQFDPIFRDFGLPTQRIRAARVRMLYPFRSNTPNEFKRLAAHEVGHSFGLQNENGVIIGRSMMGNSQNVTACDTEAIKKVYCPVPTPTPTPTPTPIPGFCNGTTDFGQYPSSGCAMGFVNSGGTCTRSSSFISQCNRFGGYDFDSCGCSGSCSEDGSCSPVVIDVSGNGFSLTDVLNGVDFDLDGNGVAERWSWTSVDSDDAWLALDRNGNGVIDGGRELFGSVTSQPPPPEGVELNGFNALAEYDTAGFGGNGDGQITALDAIFDRLRLWQDVNHNGISEPNELQTLSALGVRKIDLDYKPSRRTDRYGNRFKYRTKVRDINGAQLGRWAWDVFLLKEQ